MVVAQNLNYNFHQTSTGSGYDGIVRISVDGYYGTGALLYGGNVILTAAHVLETDDGEPVTSAMVTFELADGDIRLAATDYLIHPNYDPINDNHDLALLFLPQSADVTADRYQLYREDDEIGSRITLAGYGRSGTGDTGADPDSDPYRYKALNTFDYTAGQFLEELGRSVGWDPDPETMLIADFDSGLAVNDTLGRISGTVALGTGVYEGIIAQGDSGSPAFIDGQIAGVANYMVRMVGELDSADVDDELNSSYGEVGFWNRVSAEQSWIDQSLRAHYPDAPKTPDAVEKYVEEGESGTSLLYFMVQFHGDRDSSEDILSIDYATRDGSATAGEDYLSASGTLNLYPDEIQALIPVEVIGDNYIEADETFYLDIFNPQGGSFAGDVEILSAMRTIVDDDVWA
ncbi:MAG: trypsin-like serine protease [Deltaproteobacteria bacterium]|nr:trypsin-like serine protease [Candidatus Tharpella sp.]